VPYADWIALGATQQAIEDAAAGAIDTNLGTDTLTCTPLVQIARLRRARRTAATTAGAALAQE